MPWYLVRLAERNVPDGIALGNSIVLDVPKSIRISGRVVKVHSIQHAKLGSERVLCVYTEGNATRPKVAGKTEPAGIAGLGQSRLIGDNSSAEEVPSSRLDADDLLGGLQINVGETYAPATLHAPHILDPARIIRISRLGDEILD